MLFEAHECGEVLPPDRLRSVRRLFADSYAEYHYASSLGDARLARFLVVRDDRVVGYAAYEPVAGVAHLSNFLVGEDWRGRGVGAVLDQWRLNHASAAGLAGYSSCVCEDARSQRLKLRLGLRPTALRIGYRRGVSGVGAWGSSVVFTNCRTEVREPHAAGVRLDERRRRARAVGLASLTELLASGDVADDWYVDVLVGEHDRERAVRHGALVCAGVDLDRRTGWWHHCYQVRNRAYVEGLSARPVVLVTPPGASFSLPVKERSA
ncbi:MULTISPECIES: GNAT family N-acetyltransferase [unclassified Saccharothrix]|uniref:GNAT family N-acetyltransferase n=1 Tax=unclassified Saccharothrix TaxID=2593673 RepID=UPI00307E99CF